MAKISKIVGIVVSSLFIVMAVYLLVAPRFDYLTKEIRIIFAAFLGLYGAWRLVRYIIKDRTRDE
jgi:hypothetical protein